MPATRLNEDVCVSLSTISRRVSASTMGPIRRAINLVCALALVGAGLYLLFSILMYAERHSAAIMGAGVLMALLGSFWLWEDFIKPTPND
jgi:hypothetical protein